MWTRALLSGLAVSVLIPVAVAAPAAAPAGLTAEQIVEKNIAAKGGLEAWRAVQALSFSGKMEAGGKDDVQLPFSMELKRPRRMRVEIEFARNTAIQVYDGMQGWKIRPFLGREDVEPFTPEELKSAAMDSELDGPLVDHALKGTAVQLEGMEKVEGHDTYRLRLTTKGGQVRRLWVDATTFLETKIEGLPRRLDGRMHPVEVYYRDYRPVDGLMVPFVLESVVQGAKKSNRILIDKVSINPAVEDSRFDKPRPSAAPHA
jgi:outer membrane lipoprotein-sorting protein